MSMCLEVGASDWVENGRGRHAPRSERRGALPRRQAAEAICVRLPDEGPKDNNARLPGNALRSMNGLFPRADAGGTGHGSGCWRCRLVFGRRLYGGLLSAVAAVDWLSGKLRFAIIGRTQFLT